MSAERVRQIVGESAKRVGAEYDLVRPGWREAARELLGRELAVSAATFLSVVGDAEDSVLCLLAEEVGAVEVRSWAGTSSRLWTISQDLVTLALRALVAQAPFAAAELAPRCEALGLTFVVGEVERILGHAKSALVCSPRGEWLRRKRRSADGAYLWFLEEGEPRRIEEVAEALDLPVRALGEAMRRDGRFVRVRPEGTWSLDSWPDAAKAVYRNALDVVVDVLGETGPLTFEHLASRVVARYPVTTGRVRQCLDSELIGLTADGRIDLVERGAVPREEPEPKRPETVWVDEINQRAAFLVRVDQEVLRGSGVPIHPWIPWYLGLRRAPAESAFTGADDLGPLVVRRSTSGSHLSSLRSRARALGVVEDCRLMVVLGLDDRSAGVSHDCEDERCPATQGRR
ncbi:hypothetical protein [Actinosynnema sp. NPDC020468]|uniref:hypothetical protein n=1 Tax=Actinosynnema sp. NPDC020468 TaxID=3154488 RepID=UPI0033E09603